VAALKTRPQVIDFSRGNTMYSVLFQVAARF